MKTLRFKKILLMLLVILLATTCFKYAELLQYSNGFKIAGVLLIVLILVFNKKSNIEKSFNKLIKLYFLGIFLSVIFCYIYWGQTLLTSVFALKTYYFMFFYYAIHALRPSAKEVSLTILIGGFLYILAYLINYVTFPILIFGEMGYERRGTILFNVTGATLMIYSLFLSYYNVKFLNKKKYLVVLIFCLLVLLLRASRNAIFAVVFSIFIYTF